MNKVKLFLIAHKVDISLTASSILLTCLFHWLGVFDFLELKTYDYRFHSVRGPLTGWRASDSSYIKRGTDVVLVDVDDETWRQFSDINITWPYSRGDIWAKAIENISNAGAKVIAFDIQFDSPDTRSEYLRGYTENLSEESRQSLPGHGDVLLAESIVKAQANGTKIIMNSKIVREPTSIPPEYLAMPVKNIMEANPSTGIINDMMDIDGFSREYSIAGYLEHDRETAYLTLGLKSVKEYLGIPDSLSPKMDYDNLIWRYGPLNIKANGNTNNFLVNYYGPPSGYKLPGNVYPAWQTYPRYSLAQILDSREFDLEDDSDWMSQFLPNQIPEWILDIEDQNERNNMMEIMGVGSDYNIENSPFYNKIVIIGVSVEVLHDVKSTPFYNYLGKTQLTPGMETHANAIQTILHENYLSVFGGRATNLLIDNRFYPIIHFLLISLLCIIAFLLFTKLNIHPVFAGIVIFLEGLIYVGLAFGLFANDILWMFKSLLSFILPEFIHSLYYDSLQVSLPEVGKSYVMPIVAPLAGITFTYASNVIFQFLHEQKDKKFLKETFGTYISPDLIDKMYEKKQAPKLGGVKDHHTAFFSDIQSFSTFSELLDPEKMVRLMNEYLTEMTDVLLKYEGTLDKYIGDAIVAFYGAPAPVKDQEIKACATALEMGEKLEGLRSKWKEEGDWPDIVFSMQHRIGLNSGPMVTGNMGSEMRMNYTMMGDTVNLAARLEPAAKQYGVYIFVGENTYTITKSIYAYRFIDFLSVKGKNVPVRVYELISKISSLKSKEIKLISDFEKGLDYYFKKDWEKAIVVFEETIKQENNFIGRDTNPSIVFLDRCNYFLDNPPPDNWDGVWRMVTK